MRLSELARITNGRLEGEDLIFSDISTDTRTLNKDDVFFALKGERFDAEQYLTGIDEKASAAVVRVLHSELSIPQIVVSDTAHALGLFGASKRQAFTGKVVAVTGSSGKTTVKGMLGRIFEAAGTVLITKGNFNNHIGVPLTLVQLDAQARAVIEAGTSHPGEIATLTKWIRPDVALVTNVGMAHYAGFGSVQSIAAEKSDIYHTLVADQVAVVNLDDKFVDFFLERTQSCKKIGFTVAASVEKDIGFPVVCASNIKRQQDGLLAYTMIYEEKEQSILLPCLGKHNLNNALAASACALAVGLDPSVIATGLRNVVGEPGRLESKTTANGATVIDDTYNANPGSMMAAIDALVEHSGEKKILVLGDMGELGDQAIDAHRAVGAYANQQVSLSAVFVCGQFKEDTASMLGEKARLYDDQNELIDALRREVDSNTVLLVKGSRSAKMEKIVDALVKNVEVFPC